MSFASQVAHSDNDRLYLEGRSSRFYIDDILSSNFGERTSLSVSPGVNVDQWRLQNTVHNDARYYADSTLAIGNDLKADIGLGSFSGGRVEATKPECPPSCCVTSPRSFHGNLKPTTSSNRTPRNIIKVESCCDDVSTRTETDVTSSTTSHPVATTRHTNRGLQASDKDRFTLPAWVYCTRYSDRPSAGPRIRRRAAGGDCSRLCRRCRTSFSAVQLQQLRGEYERCRYVSNDRRRQLADRLSLDINTVKIWFQNRRANDKKASGVCNELATRLMADGLYNHHTAVKPPTSCSS